MKHLTTLLLTTLLLGGTAFAQLGNPLAQYSGNQLVYNPGYAGLYDLLSINLSARKSWVGVPGSPAIISLNGHSPFENHRHSWGWIYQHEQWGGLQGNMVYGNYAYKLNVAGGILNLGLQAGLLHHVVDWNKIDYVADPDDLTLGEDRDHSLRFDGSFGAYYLSTDWYAGFSAMHLAQPRYGIYKDLTTNKEWYSQMRSQFFLMGGYNYKIDEDWSLRPEVFMRYVHTTPFSVNVGAHAYYQNKYAVGMNFMTGQRTINFNLIAHITNDIRIGYSYGVSYGPIRKYQLGSHEISVSYSRPLWHESHSSYDSFFWL